ncbi:MAG: hypothetical protein ACRD9R_15120, partial [Pyrinomonadaceae bacterium]
MRVIADVEGGAVFVRGAGVLAEEPGVAGAGAARVEAVVVAIEVDRAGDEQDGQVERREQPWYT